MPSYFHFEIKDQVLAHKTIYLKKMNFFLFIICAVQIFYMLILVNLLILLNVDIKDITIKCK